MILNKINRQLKFLNIEKKQFSNAMKAIRSEISISQRIGRLQTMQRLFKYWHVAHLPFAIIMLLIVLIHVGVTLALGYKWIF